MSKNFNAEAGDSPIKLTGDLTAFGNFAKIWLTTIKGGLTASAKFARICSDIENYTVSQFIYRLGL
jgi:hypothetical protein